MSSVPFTAGSDSSKRSVVHFFFLSALFFWGAAIIFWPEESDRSAEAQASKAKSGEGLFKASLTKAGFGLLGVHFYESRNKRRQWEIISDFAEIHRKDNYAFLRTVRADFYAETTGNVVYTKSEYGRSWFNRDLVELEGNVTVRSERGYLFEMPRLNYHSSNHHFDTEDPVRMHGPNLDKPEMWLTGTGMVADIDRERFILKEDVQARRRLSSDEWLHIQSRKGEFLTEEQRAIFVGRARAQMRILAIDSDVLELMMDQSDESILARGHVRLRNRERLGHADSARIELGTSKIVLIGNAQIKTADNQVSGKKIFLYADDDRIEVEGAEGSLNP